MFNNKPNQLVRDEKGKVHWISRSVAVVAVIKWQNKFLIVKKSFALIASVRSVMIPKTGPG